MDKERSSLITIGGKEYRLILTTKATKEAAALDNAFSKVETFSFCASISLLSWLFLAVMA
jgi:hypothetical protein